MLCWLIAHDKGEKYLKDFIYGGDPLVFSSAFPKNYLPFPLFPLSKLVDKADIDIKKVKKQKYVKADLLKNEISMDIFKELPKIPYTVQEATAHNTINRYTNKTEEKGGLYFLDEIYYDNKYDMDIYFYNGSILDDSYILDCLETIGKFGYGKDASTGKGQFKIIKTEDCPFNSKGPNAFMSLSLGILSRDDPRNGYYKFHTKYPKHACNSNPYKKPLVMIKEGSMFFDSPIKDFYGCIINNIHQDQSIIHNAYMLPYPLYIKEDII